jgi:hypothetical protein
MCGKKQTGGVGRRQERGYMIESEAVKGRRQEQGCIIEN